MKTSRVAETRAQQLPHPPLPFLLHPSFFGKHSFCHNTTKDLEGPSHQRLLQTLPLKPTQCRRLLGLNATANGGSVVEAQVVGDEGESWTFAAQVMITILVVFVTCVILLDVALRASSILLIRSWFRRARIVLPEVNAITRRGSAKGLQNVPMNAIKRRRSCTGCFLG